MKRIILTALVGAFALVSVQAQEIPERKHDGYKPHAKEKSHNKKEMANLNLSEDQKAKFKEIRQSHQQQMEDLKKQENITVKESKERREKIQLEHQTKMQALLTADQKDQIKKNKEEQKVNMEKMAGKRSEKMKAELGLTNEQSAKMDNNRKEISEKMKAIRENKSLTDDQKKEQMKELHKRQKENMKSVLTEEQLKKLKETKHRRPGDGKKKPGMKEKI